MHHSHIHPTIRRYIIKAVEKLLLNNRRLNQALLHSHIVIVLSTVKKCAESDDV